MIRKNFMTLGQLVVALILALSIIACTKDLPDTSDKDKVEDTTPPTDEPSEPEEPEEPENPSDPEEPTDPVDPVDPQIETICTLLKSTKWSVSELYCLEEGGYVQPAAYNGDAILFQDENNLAYEDGGAAGFVYCDMNGWEAPYEGLSLTGEESWEVVGEEGKYYIQFSNGGFPLIIVDATNIDCKCEILSTAESSFQLKIVAETWGNYSYRVTFVPTSEIPEEEEPVVPESWAEGWWYHYFGDASFGLTQDVSTPYSQLTNPSELKGAVWTLSDPGVDVIKYEGCIAVGDYKNQISEFTLSTKSFPGTVYLVNINYSTDEVPVTLSCSVGGVELPCAAAEGWVASFAGEGTGELVIKFTPTAVGGAIYFDELYIEGIQN